MSDGIKDKAKNMMNKITNTKNTLEKEKNDTKNLINRVREYLAGKDFSRSFFS